MAIAYCCLLLVVVLPYLLSVAARSAAGRGDYVADPRAYSAALTGWHRRAHLAHLNAFEAVPGFIAGLLVAELMQAPRPIPRWAGLGPRPHQRDAEVRRRADRLLRRRRTRRVRCGS